MVFTNENIAKNSVFLQTDIILFSWVYVCKTPFTTIDRNVHSERGA